MAALAPFSFVTAQANELRCSVADSATEMMLDLSYRLGRSGMT
jgi:hypothetical protein